MLTLWACNKGEDLSVPENQGKTAIALSAGVTGGSPATKQALTRSVTTTGETGAKAFPAGTSVYLVLKSEKDDKDAVYTRTIGSLQGIDGGSATANAVHFASDYGRFWEDSYSRNSQLSAYAACVPGYYLAESVNETLKEDPDGTADPTKWALAGSTKYDNEWNAANAATTLVWPLRGQPVANQDAASFIASQDLCFSNNVARLPGEDKRVMFSQEHKKFGDGKLMFYHALTRVSFIIKKGEGFTDKDAFAFTQADENIVLKGFNTSGTFDITEGEFQAAPGTGTISQLAVTQDNRSTNGAYAYVLDALMLPGTDLSGTSSDEIYFTIDYNLYHMSKSMLMTALSDKTLTDGTTPALDGNRMRAGVHYEFTMTVGKKKMDNFTAAVADWETVSADEMEPSNARITLTLLDKGTKKTGTADFDLFRTPNFNTGDIDDDYACYDWETGYAPDGKPADNKAQLQEPVTNSGVYTAEEALDPHTAWYWPDNKTFYHFRTVMPKTDDSWSVIEDAAQGDYITLSAGFTGTYRDVCWGAPLNATTGKLIYDQTHGFDGEGPDHQISKAIGPTKGTINMILFHMMSDVTIRLTTTDGEDKVDLTNAKMELKPVHTAGKVLMGSGLVSVLGDAVPVSNRQSAVSNQVPWQYGFIPQSLSGVELTITTADNNLYIVTMKDVVATTVGDNIIDIPYSQNAEDKYVIDRWLPGYKYTYTFKLSKAGIAKISASLADWQQVPADEQTVQIQ